MASMVLARSVSDRITRVGVNNQIKNMKKVITSMLFLSLIIPSTTLAYSYSSSARSFSVPSRSFSTYRPTYTPTVRTITTPVRSQPQTTVTPTRVDAGIRTMGISNVARQQSTVSNTSWNPFNGNFFLWYTLFGGANRINKNNSTTTNATK